MALALCLDFGNTRLKCGLLKDGAIQEIIVLPNDHPDTILQLLNAHPPDFAVLSSVINHNEAIEGILAQHTRFHKLDHHSKLPISTPVGKKETMGADRLALMSGAVDQFPGKHNLVIGLGTCITFNFLNKYHEFIGGSISPGMEMRFKALHAYTAKLPLVIPDWNYPLIGYDTRTNILSGVLIGMAKEIDGTIDYYRDKYENFNVLLTGGDMAFFATHVKNEIFADPDLLFKGLYAIGKRNLYS